LESDFSTEVAYLVPESGISSDPETDPVDSDQDGISDTDELTLYGTDPDNPDTDADGISDADELNFWNDIWNADNDSDGIINLLDPTPDETPATTAQLTLAWDTNSETDLAGYKIHYGLQSRTYDTTCDVGNFTSCTIADLTPGTTYYFAATAYNTDGLESDFSTEVSYLVP
ncbi:MAG: fibronectin type III domain-containing protein, partial [Bacilli bacterium]